MGRLTLVVGLFALTAGPMATGCSSTSANQSAPDAAAYASDDGSFDTAACTAAGGQCVVGSVSCAMKGPQSCGPPGPGGTFCCLDATVSDAGACSSENPEFRASDYDQACTTDSDCVEIYVGNPCSCDITCGIVPAAINKSAEAQYVTDVRNLPPIGCACQVTPPPLEGVGPCCIGGSCQFGQCPAAGDAAADTGADAGTDGGGADADACPPTTVCSASCVSGTHNVSTRVDGCLVWECCVPDDAGAEEGGG